MSAMGNAYALVIGIANYNQINPLPETVLNDARKIHALLVNPQHCGYPINNVTLLLDGEATQAGLRRALAALAMRADNRSTVFIYISSHGGRIVDGPNAGEYL